MVLVGLIRHAPVSDIAYYIDLRGTMGPEGFPQKVASDTLATFFLLQLFLLCPSGYEKAGFEPTTSRLPRKHQATIFPALPPERGGTAGA